MKRWHELTVLLYSLFRKRLAMIVLLAILPPTLILISFSLSINVIETYSERLLEYASNTAITISEKTDSLSCCLSIRYGLMTIVSRDASLRAQVIMVDDVVKLKNLTNINLRIAGSGCEHVRVSVSPVLIEVLNISLGEPIKVCADNECFAACVAYYHDKRLKNYLIIEGINESTRLNEGFLCVRDAREVDKSLIRSLINELTEFSKNFVLIVLSTYVPVLYLADVKLLEELSKELKILSTQGVSVSDLRLVFALSTSLITGLVTIYSTALGYLVVSAGVAILRVLGNQIIPTPELRVEHVTLAIIATLLNFLISYLVFRGGRRVIS
ncbi:MAG: hypothetical protein QW036_02465 [Zestosphaera sp.]